MTPKAAIQSEPAAARSAQQKTSGRKTPAARAGKKNGAFSEMLKAAVKKPPQKSADGHPLKLKESAESGQKGRKIPEAVFPELARKTSVPLTGEPELIISGRLPLKAGAEKSETQTEPVKKEQKNQNKRTSLLVQSAPERQTAASEPALMPKPVSDQQTGLSAAFEPDPSAKASKSDAAVPDLSSKAARVEVTDRRQADINAKPARLAVLPSNAESGAAVPSLLTAEMDVEITPQNTGKSAAAQLAEKLEGQQGNEIVRQVKVIMNRSDAGEVRINLRPDNLGRVRVHIQMEDNRLSGRIFVESAAAREAFRSALDSLQTRLVESGFGAADLELSWEGGDSGAFAQNDSGSKRTGRAEPEEILNDELSAVPEPPENGLVNMVV